MQNSKCLLYYRSKLNFRVLGNYVLIQLRYTYSGRTTLNYILSKVTVRPG